MKQIKNTEYEEYLKYVHDRDNGRILTADGLRFICESYQYDPEKIGKHMLDVLGRVRNEPEHLML